MINTLKVGKSMQWEKYLFSQPPDVFEVGVCGGRGPKVGVDVSQRMWQQGGDVGVDGGEPGVGGGAVLTAQHHRVLAVWGVELQQSEREVKHVQGDS